MITRLWIEQGCIACSLCADLVPEAFEVPAGELCRPRPGHAGFLARGGEAATARVQEAVDACPVEVIQAEQGPGKVREAGRA